VTLVDPHLNRLQRELSAELQNWTPEQLSWRIPGKWSAGEILEHLYLTYTGTLKGLERILDAGTPKASLPTWKNRAQAMIVVSLGYLPSGRQSPLTAQPKGLPAAKVAHEIGATIGLMDEGLTQCAAKFGTRTRILDHPFLGPFSTNQWGKFHLVHGRHHLKQIQRLRVERNRTGMSGR
jgi:hypothetical protein